MTVYHLAVLGSLVVAAFAQMALKKSASIAHRSWIFEYLNVWVIGGYALMLLSIVIDVWAVGKGVMVKELSTMESCSYLIVPLLGNIFFDEKITPGKWGAIALILGGVTVFFL